MHPIGRRRAVRMPPQEHEHSRAFGEDGTAAVWSYGLAMPSRVARPGGFARMAADGPTARCAACRLCAPSAPPHIAHVYCRDCCATACVRPLGLWPWRRPAPPALRVRHQTTGGLMAVDDYVYSSPRVTDRRALSCWCPGWVAGWGLRWTRRTRAHSHTTVSAVTPHVRPCRTLAHLRPAASRHVPPDARRESETE